MSGEGGQAQIELLGSIPVIFLVGALVLQLMAFGLVSSATDGAAQAAAIAIAAGERRGDVEQAALDALPAWARGAAEVEVEGGRVIVRARPRTILPGLGSRLESRSGAWARPPEG